MRLWHSTDQQGRDGIAAHGFRHEDPPVGPAWDAPDRGYVWFADTQDEARRIASRRGWFVAADVPDDTPEHALDEGQPYPGNYRLGMAYVNSLSLSYEMDG